MKIVMTHAVVDEGNGDAPLTYTVDGVEKKIGWSALHDLFEERFRETDQDHTPEQRLLARIVEKFWVDDDDWWTEAWASDDQVEPAEPESTLGCDYRGSHFGAPYPDAQCVDGMLWDEDSCDEPGGPLLSGGDIRCPKCNAADSQANAEAK
ncbi:hypothetical protein ACYSUW_13430 [Pseudomonas frederiksbergensis]